jgi:hypothetical protein
MARVRHPKDFVAGLLFIAVGIAAIAIAANYPLGTAARMGPGYFPRILGILLIVLGGILSMRALRLHGAPLPRWPWRPTVVVLASVVIYGIVVTRLGIVLSTIALIFASSAASREWRPRESIVAGVLLAALVVAVFVYGLKLLLPIWPVWRP